MKGCCSLAKILSAAGGPGSMQPFGDLQFGVDWNLQEQNMEHESRLYAVGTWSFSYWGGEMVALWWLHFTVPATQTSHISAETVNLTQRLCFSLMMWSTCFILMIAACPRMLWYGASFLPYFFSEMGFLHSSSNHKIYPCASPYTQAHLYAWTFSAYILSKIKNG